MLVIDGMMVRLGEFSLKANISVPRDVTRLAIVGPSGSGKSTFLGALGGFVPLDSGRIYHDDTEISAASAVARPIAHLFQDNNLFPHMSAAQNVGLGIVPNLRLTQEDRELVEHALDAVGIGGMGSDFLRSCQVGNKAAWRWRVSLFSVSQLFCLMSRFRRLVLRCAWR